MTHLINKAALVAEIERRVKLNDTCQKISGGNEFYRGAIDEAKEILSFLDTIEVKEVDLEKEIRRYRMRNPIIQHKEESLYNYMSNVAKHFFELGLQARINKELVKEVYSHIDSIKDTADRMTSGNFMPNRAAITSSANTIAKAQELIGLKTEKGE